MWKTFSNKQMDKPLRLFKTYSSLVDRHNSFGSYGQIVKKMTNIAWNVINPFLTNVSLM